MDNLDLLTDDELRLRLRQYGFENLPITITTRKTLIKKLRNHISNTNNNLRKTTSLITRYSSGEDSDNFDGSKTDNAKTKKSRMTVSGSPGKRNTIDHIMPPPRSITVPKPVTPQPSVRQSFNSSGNKKNSVYVSPVIINDSEDDIDWNIKKTRAGSGVANSKPSYASRTRSDNNLDSSQESNGNDHDESDDANSTSDYTRRLLQFREGNIQRQTVNPNTMRKRPTYVNHRFSDHPVSENDIVYHAEPSLEPAHIPLNTAIRNFINRLDAAYGFKQSFIPGVLVTFLIVFFLLIIFAYVTINPNIENIINPSTTFYAPCDSSHESDATYSCINQHDLEPSLDLLRILASELQTRAVNQKCGDKSSSISNVVCLKDFWEFLHATHPQSQHLDSASSQGLEMIKNVHNIEYLIDRNKHWGVQNVDEDGTPVTLDGVLKLRPHQSECFAILKPKLPLLCTIYNKIQTFFVIIGTLTIISLIVIVLRKFYQFVLAVKERRRNQVDQLIREICSTLMEKAINDKENSSVVLNHLRDKLIEPSRRSELAWAWQDAITYLEQNDSRIHFGVENINGEDFKTMKWIEDVKNLSQASPQPPLQPQQSQQRVSPRYSTQPPDNRTYATMKKWMGSAFDKSNKIKDPPTNCLKIRHMFDSYEANDGKLKTVIQNTILYKLRNKSCKIYDIQLDVKTCCVYVKCATCVDAGIVHEEINGNWLEAGLVVVKFLKQDKYHQRFPNSINACTVLQTSSPNLCHAPSHEEYYDEDMDDDDYE